jgi:hypothetical protein
MVNSASARKKLLAECLEHARQELVRRLHAASLPTSVDLPRLVTNDNADGGSTSTWKTIKASSLRLREVGDSVRDDTVPHMTIGLRGQLQPLAEYLDKHSDLGKPQPVGMLPAATGPDAILARYLSPLAVMYVAELEDAATPDPSIVDRIADELTMLCDSKTIRHTRQLVLAGLKASAQYGPYKKVVLRPLSPDERGAIFQSEQTSMMEPRTISSNLVIPKQFRHFWPTTLLEITTERQMGEMNDVSLLPNRVALAFYLGGFDISGPGSLTGFDQPRWATLGISHSAFPVTEKMGVTEKAITLDEFKRVVDLAYKVPDFSGLEGSGKEIVLYRVLRGCGAQDSGFLDFAIALEAALLGGAKTELAYRFSLYGALFLHAERNPAETFEKLKTIYDVRSRLVHGSRIKPEVRQAAEKDVADLAKLITKKAVEDEWPDSKKLDELALTTELGK